MMSTNNFRTCSEPEQSKEKKKKKKRTLFEPVHFGEKTKGPISGEIRKLSMLDTIGVPRDKHIWPQTQFLKSV